ncbi:FadR/GntR family transcriptional regulator [Paenibacillus aceris]|uniref:DNA-binding FadR family transcriptional regulator n=1 Tax=Paenibacillus aceris TaxID=869555 RepID=A0ABS4I3M4_9BACL|nr:FadR/GntR family transcriptional regulator [Paenibacillus aceris]MBP1965330.1 DNA-binding FadR family transcriptional regulator [Paenibacillus aceris]NHW36010.1 FadR family transcriptional regulator [Paenibacillus aceris]
MEVNKLLKRNHYDEMADQIKQMILQGQLQTGDKLPSTKELSERFGVGRSTAREALSALKAMGLIEIRQGGGCRVISQVPTEVLLPEMASLRMNRTTLLELMEVRQSLEVSIAAIAAKNRTEKDLHQLHLVLNEMVSAVGNDIEGERTDVSFHVMLVQATHNAIMERTCQSIIKPMEVMIRDIRRAELYANQDVAIQLLKEHTRIYEAIRSGDQEQASQAMRSHLEHVESILVKYI